MGRKFNQLLLLSLVAVIVLLSFTACGSTAPDKVDDGEKETPSSEEPSKTDEDKPAVDEPTEQTELSLWHIQNREPMPGIFQGSIDRFMADNPEYNVTIDVIANDAYKQKITVAMSSDSTPDIYPHWSGGPMIEYIKSGHTADITEYMNKDNYKDKFLDASIAQATYEDKLYAVPIENVAIAGIFYNKDLFEKYDLSEPNTMKDLEEIADTLIENGIVPFSLANKTQWTGSMYYMYFATRFGGIEPFNDAASGEGSFESEPFVYAGNQVQKWVDAKYFNEGFNGLDEDSGQSRELLYGEQAAMTVMGSWFVQTVKGENPDFYEKVGFFLFPSIEESSADPNIVVGTVGDNFYSVSGSCEDPEGAFKAITYLIDDTAVQERKDAGKIVPFKDFTSDDPILQTVLDKVKEAPAVQLWYDQYLAPEVADVHKATSQEIFGKTMTPEDANTKMQEAIESYNAKE
ncbi:MAG TPA: extracellular solute-binding protein [Clostridia bacterium]|nr:extracellular solute-binding protein [Clostridia bacterium]